MFAFLRSIAVRVHSATLRLRGSGDRGSFTTEMVLGITIAIAIATVVGTILVSEFTDAAKSIDLGVDR